MSHSNLHRILIVEDDPNTADMLSSYFSAAGYAVSHAAWGEDALKLATEQQPDLVVLDIHLPDIDGYQVCLRLRSQRRTEHIPVIFLTERRERLDRLAGLELGAVDYITKPFDIEELQFRVRNVLHRGQVDALLHPITNLPMSVLVEEQIEQSRRSGEFVLVGLALREMRAFSDAYGFVTHDDVLRAVALILRNTASEAAGRELFVGQLDAYRYLVITPAGQAAFVLMGRLDQRLREAISFFYPHRDLEEGQRADGSAIPEIGFTITHIASAQTPEAGDLAALGRALFGN